VPRTVPQVMPPTPINSPSYHPDLDAGLQNAQNWRAGTRSLVEVPRCRTAQTLHQRHDSWRRETAKNLKEPLNLLVRISGVNSLLLADFCSAGILHDRPPHLFAQTPVFRRFGSRSGCPGRGHPLNA